MLLADGGQIDLILPRIYNKRAYGIGSSQSASASPGGMLLEVQLAA